MIEGPDAAEVERDAEELAELIEKKLGGGEGRSICAE
jgi:hypothetical protein